MKLGIRSFKYVPLSSVNDYSMVPPGTTIKLSQVFSQDPVAIPLTNETCEFNETWSYDENGSYSNCSFSASVRADKENYRSVLQKLQGKKAVFIIETIAGIVYVLGSIEFVPTFTYVDRISGQSSSEFNVKVENRSLHGALLGVV